MSETTKILITFSEVQLAALSAYATDHGLMYGGKPNISAAVRGLCAKGLELDMIEADLKSGNPNFVSKDKS